MLTEHYIWRAIEQAKRIADRIGERWAEALRSILRLESRRVPSSKGTPWSLPRSRSAPGRLGSRHECMFQA